MNEELNDLGASGLRFFGAVTASLSHEIKNVLAIINENAGLLDDVSVLAKKGRPIDIERMERIAATLLRSVKRADDVVKNLNRFAHSVDSEMARVDLREFVSLACALFGRFASMRGVAFVTVMPDEAVPVTTRPFHLKQLLWRCFDYAMSTVGESKAATITVENSDSSPQLRFSGLRNPENGDARGFFSECDRAVMSFLRASISIDPQAGDLVVALPENMEG